MAKIQSPLKAGSKGAAVASLQDGLKQLLERGTIAVANKAERLELTVALAAERLESAYGPATEKLVCLWQEQHKLKSSGKVNKATAASLDAALPVAVADEAGPSLPPASPFAAPLYEGAEGADVALAHDILTGLGLRIAPAELRERRFGKSSAAAASAWQKLRGLAETGVLDKPALDRLAADGRGLPRMVSGVVRLDDGTPVPGLPVVAFDRDFRDEQELGRAVTDRRGRYRIAYTSGDFARLERGAADLGVRVLSADGATIVHAPRSSDLMMNAPREVTSNIVVALARASVPSEFELIAGDLRPLIGRIPFADIGRERDSDEGDFLALETGLDLGRIAHFVVAHRLGDDSGQPPEYFYALLREDGLFGIAPGRPRAVQTPVGLASDTRAVLFEAVLLDEEVAAAAVARALRKRLVPPSVGQSAASIRKALQRWREEAEAFARREVPRNILGVVETLIEQGKSLEMLGFLETFDPAYLTNLHRQLDDLGAFAPGARGKAESRLKLGELLGFNLGLVEEVSESLGAETPDDVRRLARLERKEWTDLLVRGAQRVSLGGEAIDPALARRQSSIIVRRFEKSFPTTAFTAQLARRKSRAIPEQDRIVELMEAHPGLELREHNLVPFLKEAGVDPGSVAPEVIEGVEKVQRVFQLTGDFRKTEGLLGAGYGASADIVEAGRGRFVADARRFAGMDAVEAKAVFRAAENTNLAAIMVAANLRTLSGPIAPQGAAAASLAKKINQIVADQPSLKSLFGGEDVCECVHCRSIYSPACYVTDVLRFLRNRLVRSSSGPSTKTAKDVLFNRRPDLGEIDLNCDNAHVEVPHIDIVCELAEEACAPDPGFAFTGAIADGAASASLLAAVRAAGFEIGDDATVYGEAPGPYMLRDKGVAIAISGSAPTWILRRLRQTHGTSEERAAAPEYVNKAAYALLATAKAAFELPFDLSHAETGALLAAAGVERAALMEALAVGPDPSPEEIAAETLGLSSSEAALIFAPSVADQAQIWGVAAPTAAPTMAKLDVFTQRTGLQYRELGPLLAGTYVRQGVDLFIRHLKNNCTLADKEIVNLDDNALDRMHRMLRLARKTGVSARDIDRLAAAPKLGAGDLGNAALLSLATLRRVSNDLKVGIGRLITWLDRIPIDGERSDHAQLFQNPARTGKLDDDLVPQAIRDNEAAELAVPLSGVKLAALAPDLALAFGVRAADVDVLLERLGDPALFGANPALTFATLAALHGRIGLLRALSLKAEDLVTLERLAGVDPLANATALDQFVKTVRAIAKTGIRVSELAFRLAPTAADFLTPELADAAILKALDALENRLIEAATANLSPYDDDLGSSEQIPAFEAILQRQPFMDVELVTKLVDILRLEAPSATGAAAAAAAAKSVVDGPLAGLINGAAAKLAIDAIVTDALGTGANTETLRKTFLALVMQGLADSARQTASLAAVDAAVAELLRVSPEIAGTILHGEGPLGKGATLLIAGVPTPLSDILTAGNVNEISDGTLDWAWHNSSANLHRALRLAHAISKFILPFEPSVETLAFLLENAPALGWLPLDRIPFEATSPPVPLVKWLQLADVFALIAEYPAVLVPGQPGVTVSASSLFVLTLDATTVRADLLDALAILTGWPRDLLDDVDTRFGFARPDYRLPTTWRRLARAIELVHSLDVSLAQALAFTVATLGDAERRNARTMLRARYSDSEWLGALKAIMDPIRARKRDALVGYLLAANPNLTSKADLYDHFLTDTEWSPKMPSSRIVHAHGTLQLFIQRCIAGLEPDATADLDGDPDWNCWQWMKNYRLWEVNRKVFVEAQYYIRPEWRDDKTEPFADMESALLQNEINQENIDAAYEGYLDRLDEIAFMEVLATCYDFDREDMHIFARTKGGDPRAYFHRMLQRERVLTPWTKIDLDITGEHLIAFFRNKRLYLAWATFLEKGDEDQSATYPSPDSAISDLKAERFTQIGLAISEYTGKKWLPRRTSEGTIDTPKQNRPLDRGKISLAVTPNKTRFAVDVLWHGDSRMRLGYFLLTGCKGYPEAVNERAHRVQLLPEFKDAPLQAQRFVEENRLPDDELAIRTGAGGSAFNTLFRLTPGNFRVTFPFQASELDQLLSALMKSAQFDAWGDFAPKIFGTLMPFFFEDNLRGYMLVPGFYGELNQETGIRRTAKTFSNVRRLVMDVIALVVKYLKLLGAAPNAEARQAVLEQLAADEGLARILAEIASYRRTEPGLVVRNFYHPRSCYLRERFFEGGVPLLLARATQLAKGHFRFEDMLVGHAPTSLIKPPYPVEEMEFGRESAYGVYNFELTFHAPHLIATKLIEAGEFDQAETWLRYIFDPLGSSNEPAPRRHWNTKPFYLRSAAEYGEQLATAIMDRIASDPNGTIETELADAVVEWRRNPLKPYLIARSRTVVFQQAIVDATIRMFIGRGDQYFRRDQLEDLVMASLDYSRAERLLGPRPKLVPPAVEPPPETYNQLEAKIDLFGNALRKIENLVPDLSALPHGGAELPPPPISLESLYFCVPPSEKLFQLWDLLEERQFNLRNSRTIDGGERSLSLFAPPLSVEEMIKAAAAGLSMSAIVSGLGAPKPPYRFRVMLRHAVELAEAANGFGRELQQALASRDGEGMARLKADQQIRFLKEQTANLKQEIKVATLARESAKKTRQIHFETQSFYANRPYMNNWEVAANISYGASLALQSVVAVGYAASGGLALIPGFMIGAAGFGGTPTANTTISGTNFSSSARDFVVGAVGALSAALDKAGSMLEHQGNYLTRKEDWSHSAKTAQREMERADIEIAIADIREAIAKEHLRLNGVQQQQAAAEDVFLKTKFTSRELYEWLGQQLRGLSKQMYNLAFEAAKAAERCFNFELGTTESFVRPGQWNDTRRGLLASENLGLDLRRMDSAYLTRNVREREITKHISLSRLDPIALMELRTSGRCVIQVPEAIFDLEHPGHYFRRIKSLTVSLPSVAGPYSSVPLKLTQTSNRVRVETSANPAPIGPADAYDEVPGADPRFRYNVGSIQTIETSRGDEDGGLFSLDLGDERYLPYEGSGACGTFMAELPAKIRSFDYGTISDVILTMRYTARDGGGGFRTMVETGLERRLNAMAVAASRKGLWHAFDLRRDLPDVWHRLVSTGKADLAISAAHLPYFVSARVDQILTSRLVVRAGSPTPAVKVNGAAVTLNAPAEPGLAGLLSGGIAAAGLGVPLTIEATTPSKLEEMIVIVNYTIL